MKRQTVIKSRIVTNNAALNFETVLKNAFEMIYTAECALDAVHS